VCQTENRYYIDTQWASLLDFANCGRCLFSHDEFLLAPSKSRVSQPFYLERITSRLSLICKFLKNIEMIIISYSRTYFDPYYLKLTYMSSGKAVRV
jgi:hypothetical protein